MSGQGRARGRGSGSRGGSGRGGRGGGENGRGGGGRGRGNSGQGRGGRGGSRGRGDFGAGRGRGGVKMTREEKKDMRRNRQQQAVQSKANKETQYFWSCVDSRHSPRKKLRENDLFGVQSKNSGIDFDKYDSIKVECSDKSIKPLDTFEEILPHIGEDLMRSISRMGYQKPTPIQKYALPCGFGSNDLMCSAQTGSGKTASFLVPTISSLLQSSYDGMEVDMESRGVYPTVVILAPTRELASQIDVEARKLCYYTPLKPVCIYGGVPAPSQLKELASSMGGKIILTATPGRLNDFLQRGIIFLSKVTHLILDEADRMLDMGFEPQVRQIVQKRDMPPPNSRTTFMFSATFPSEIQKLAKDFLRSGYVWIAVGRVGSTTDTITQRLLLASSDRSKKLSLLEDQLKSVDGRTLVFVRMKRTASQVKKKLKRDFGIEACEIHGDRSQSQRESALDSFRKGNTLVLIATNVAARGLDIPEVTHVINFDLPVAKADFDEYVHRIGRTGRAGHRGLATSFYVPGFDPKQGNGTIAPDLLKLLHDGKQEIPDWFLALPEVPSKSFGRPNNNGAQRQTDHRATLLKVAHEVEEVMREVVGVAGGARLLQIEDVVHPSVIPKTHLTLRLLLE
eukprot:CAMPEP_0203754854 /NCGR_PEP_ID=MMETSP0098-20131031/8403_1 /ASSEMBLY_ACC=CAM_ASM_000208 /TAXON_ID=96639 /ORGANISM=" , Strain NY0313808BC1" /LENGTH=622 /DNA_ID=CAMNT_0050646079 /DNA_START=1196 /DNA_END=3065 /DNA_ORIENTATION=-